MMIPVAVDEDFRELAEWIASLGSENVKHLPGQHDQLDHGVRGGGDVVPPLPGTVPIPPGEVRLFHRTLLSNAASIRENGLTVSNARGETYGEPNQVWASAGIRSSQAQNVIDGGIMDSDYVVVEFHMPTDRLDIGNGRDAADLEARQSDVTIRGDVPPENIIAVHEPWEAAYRTLAGPDYIEQVRAGEFDNFLGDPNFPGYSRALEILGRGGKGKHLPGQHDQLDHGNRGLGGLPDVNLRLAPVIAGKTDAGAEGSDKLQRSVPGLDEEGYSTVFDQQQAAYDVKNSRIGDAIVGLAGDDEALMDQITRIGESDLGATGEYYRSVFVPQSPEEMGALVLALRLDQSWQTTTLDGDAVSWGMQLAEAERLGLNRDEILGTLSDHREPSVDGVTPESIGVQTSGSFTEQAQAVADSPGVRAYIDAVYGQGQVWFEELGIKEITLYRGVNFSRDEDPFQVTSGSPTKMVDMYPLSAWSTSKLDADYFADGLSLDVEQRGEDRVGYTMTATFPVERIFSYSLTGLGASDVDEVVTLSGPDVSVEMQPGRWKGEWVGRG